MERDLVDCHVIHHYGIASIAGGVRPVVDPHARSPYRRYGKREYKYSQAYTDWRRRVLKVSGAKMIGELDANRPKQTRREDE